jgi:hypothetical protein
MLVKCHSVLLRCYYVISVCDSHPCLFGGTCTPLDSSTYQCRCAAGFSGTHCQIIGKFYILNDFETPQNTHKGKLIEIVLCIGLVQQYFSYIVGSVFIGGGNQTTRRKPQTCHKSLTNFIT